MVTAYISIQSTETTSGVIKKCKSFREPSENTQLTKDMMYFKWFFSSHQSWHLMFSFITIPKPSLYLQFPWIPSLQQGLVVQAVLVHL